MDKTKCIAKPAAVQAETQALTFQHVRVTWTRENSLAEHRAPGEITGEQLARILGTLDRLRNLANWNNVMDVSHAQCLLAGVQEILTSIIGTYGELESNGLGIINDAVKAADAIMLPGLPGPQDFTVHLTPAAAGGTR